MDLAEEVKFFRKETNSKYDRYQKCIKDIK